MMGLVGLYLLGIVSNLITAHVVTNQIGREWWPGADTKPEAMERSQYQSAFSARGSS